MGVDGCGWVGPGKCSKPGLARASPGCTASTVFLYPRYSSPRPFTGIIGVKMILHCQAYVYVFYYTISSL
jgi:hypothetical protein